MNTIRAILADHPLLGTMDGSHLDIIAACGQEAACSKNQFLLRQGEPADRFFLILQGKVALESHDPQRGDVAVLTLGRGELLGWSWLLQPFVWHYQARALEDTATISFNGAHLLIACEENHDFGYELMKRFTQVLMHRLLATRKLYLDERVNNA